MKILALAFTLIAIPAQAEECHHYSKWLYPYPQPRCGIAARGTDKTWFVEFVLPDVKPEEKIFQTNLPRFTVSKYDTIILHLPPGTSDEDGRAAAIDILREVMGK